MLKERFASLRRVLNEWRIQALKNVGICFQSQANELLKLPVAFFLIPEFKLLGNAVERPLKICWRQVNSTPVHIGIVAIQPECTRTDNALVHNVLAEFLWIDRTCRIAERTCLHLFQDPKLLAVNLCLGAVSEPYGISGVTVNWRLDNFSYGARRVV